MALQTGAWEQQLLLPNTADGALTKVLELLQAPHRYYRRLQLP